MASAEELNGFHASLERCRRAGGFIDHFYDLFVGSSPEVAAKFRDTDFHRQKRMLTASLYMLTIAAEGHPEGRVHLDRLAVLHDRRHHDIRPELYFRWLDCLLHAVRDCDPDCTPEVEAAWRAMLAPGIAIMTAAY